MHLGQTTDHQGTNPYVSSAYAFLRLICGPVTLQLESTKSNRRRFLVLAYSDYVLCSAQWYVTISGTKCLMKCLALLLHCRSKATIAALLVYSLLPHICMHVMLQDDKTIRYLFLLETVLMKGQILLLATFFLSLISVVCW